MPNGNNNNNRNKQNDSAFVQAVPLIITAIAAFLAVCFIFGDTGSFGHGVTSVFGGLFAKGAYAIPILLCLHALFFKIDRSKRAVISRIVFSAIIVLIVASIDYMICYWGTEPAFDAARFYTEQICGGFVGGLFAFCVTFIVGAPGLIILDATVVLVYAILFFGRKDSAARQGVLSLLELFASLLAVIEGKIKKNAEIRREAKAEEKRLETERHHAELIDDQFFESESDMDKLDIPELGIHQSKDPKNAERNPTLQSKVFKKSAVSKEEMEREKREKSKTKEPEKKNSFNFNIDTGTHNSKTSSSDESAVFFGATGEKFGSERPLYDTRENASEVFTKDFDPFDFATGEKLIAKQSTKATSVKKQNPNIDDSTSLIYVTEESIAAMHRRNADAQRRQQFEARKAEIFGRPAPKPAEDSAAATGVSQRPASPEKTPVSPNIHIPGFSVSAPPSQTPKAPEKTPVSPDIHVPGFSVSAPKAENPAAPVKTPVSPDIHVPGFSVAPPAGERPAAPEKTPVSPDIRVPGFNTSSTSVNTNTEPTSILRPTMAEAVTTEATFGTPPEITDMEYVQVTDEIVFDDSNDEEIRKIAESAAWGRPARVEEEAEPEPEVSPIISAGNPEEKDFDTVAEEIAQLVRMNNPAYARSANKAIFTTTVHEQSTPSSTTAAGAREEGAADNKEEESAAPEEPPLPFPLVIEDVTYDDPATSEEPASFAPYTPPTVADTPAKEAAPVLVTERELIPPAPAASADRFAESETEVKAPAIAPAVTPTIDDALFSSNENLIGTEGLHTVSDTEEGTVFNFGDEDDASPVITHSEAASYAEEPADELLPIPPEEQNPDVIKQRAMFPFLDEENEAERSEAAEAAAVSKAAASPVPELKVISTEKTAEDPVETKQPTAEKAPDLTFDEEDDTPPFDIESSEKTAVVPAVEKPKKKDYSDFVLPPIDLLLPAGDERSSDDVAAEIQDNADKLIDTLASFGVTASIKGVDRGPRITRYEVVPARGTKVSSIMNLDNDIALNLAADGIRMEAPIPGKTAVGVEIPNKKASLVRLRELIETDDYRDLKSKTTVCMGKDVAGQPIFADVAKMPHALVAGATGMGKSVWINSLMLSILYKARPDEVKFIMIDPKQVEFTMYNGIPHLLVPVVTDVKQAAGTLMWAVEEMERRYGVLQSMYVRNIDSYNDKIAANPALGEPMSRIIIVIDEFAELIMQAKNPVESLIIRIAQKARAAGIHLIIGTQKPVKEVITGLIKSNIPSKFTCKVASNRDSMLIFDTAGAEKLLDKGDMLVSFANSIKPLRVQSAFVEDDEVEGVMKYLQSFSGGANYDESVMEEIKRAADKCSKKGGSDRDEGDEDDGSAGEGYLNDKQFLAAVELAVNTNKISTALIQRKLAIGYGKAARFIDVMVDMGIVGEQNGSKPREVLLTADEWHEKLARTSYD